MGSISIGIIRIVVVTMVPRASNAATASFIGMQRQLALDLHIPPSPHHSFDQTVFHR